MEKKEIVELKHPYHFHPMIFFEEEDVEGVFCNGCSQPISAPFYACERCLFFLHKFCAELPKTITHFFHTQHPLYLSFMEDKYFRQCEFCEKVIQSEFFYGCHNCRFIVDLKCTSKVLKVKQVIEHHPNHTHKLVPLDQSAIFVCNACNIEHEGNSFLCTECGFWVNQKCASSPTSVKLGAHDHPLTLLQCIPESFHNRGMKCQICSLRVKRNQWVYFCPEHECKYFVHMRCSISEIEHSSDGKVKNKAKKLVHTNVMELPWTNDSAADNLIAQLIKNIISSQAKKKKSSTTTNDDDVVNRQTMTISNTTLDHIHQHPLIFSDNLQTGHPHGESSSSSSSIIIASCKQSENKLCNGCGYTILAGVPFYYCDESECHNNFCLHQWCATLPNELEHVCHPQHKLLLITRQSRNFNPRQCTCCDIYCDTFFFGCVGCGFYVDVKCAGLPSGIRHASHDQHVLTLRRGWGCNACGSRLGYYSFVCEVCKHRVCIECALLPGSVRHRYDKHPFTLTYSFPNVKDKDHPAEVYYCEICEDDIEPNHWFYHCHEYCDQSLHIKCIFTNFNNRLSNMKCKTLFKAPEHPDHSLTFVPTPENNGDNSFCSRCRRSIAATWVPFVIKCTECNFQVHWNCMS